MEMKYFGPMEEDFDKLVKGVAQKKVFELEENIRERYNVSILQGVQGDKYLACYYQTMEDISEHDIIGPSNTFIRASCMCKALIQEGVVRFKIDKEIPKEVLFINFDIAFAVACAMIKEPVTFCKDEVIKHPKLTAVVVPRGTIPDCPIRQSILEAMKRDYLNNHYFSVMQFSNLLHLLYLYNI